MSTATIAPTGTWNVDTHHSRVGFAVKHLGIATVRGTFKEFEGTLEIGDDLTTAKAYGKVKTASVDTNEAARDEHLRNSDFFDVEQYPEITFESTKIESLSAPALRCPRPRRPGDRPTIPLPTPICLRRGADRRRRLGNPRHVSLHPPHRHPQSDLRSYRAELSVRLFAR